jgi:hypothetical protein
VNFRLWNCHNICGTVNSACRFNDPLFCLNCFLKKMKENSLVRAYNRMDSMHYLNLVLQVNHSDLLWRHRHRINLWLHSWLSFSYSFGLAWLYNIISNNPRIWLLKSVKRCFQSCCISILCFLFNLLFFYYIVFLYKLV